MNFLQPGFDLDRQVAIEVMGDAWVGQVIWEHRENYWICTRTDIAFGGECRHIGELLPAYSSDMTAAWKIVEKMRERTLSVRHNFLQLIQEFVSLRVFNKMPEHAHVAWPDVLLYTTAPDLCHAGIRAMEMKRELIERHFGKPKV